MIQRVKGTQDFLDLSLFNFLITQTREHLNTYAFCEIATPILEPTELFKRSLGLQTDVVTKEMFTVLSHKSDATEQEGICLRPEATASMVRAFIENNVQTTPWKVWQWGAMFRYERPQKGRFRQFHQISMEIIGSQSVAQDAHFIKMLDRFFHEKLRINNYAILVNYLGCPDDRKRYATTLKKFLDSVSDKICATCTERKEKNTLRIFDCKNGTCQEIYTNAPSLIDSLCAPCTQEWQELQRYLDFLSVAYKHQPTLVRGLDYYSKTVFEFVSGSLGAQNAFCAGGRYDQLVQQLGGDQDQPSLGAAMGIERLMLMLEAQQGNLPITKPPRLHAILPLAAEQHGLALLLADTLQAAGLATEIFLEGDSVKSMMRKANKLGAAFCLLLGDEELQKKEVTIKNMVTGQEAKVPQVEALNFLKG